MIPASTRTLRAAIAAALAAASIFATTTTTHAAVVNVSPDINAPGSAFNANGWNGGALAHYPSGIPTWSFNLATPNPGTYMWLRTPATRSGVSLYRVFFTERHTGVGGPSQAFGLRLCQSPGIYPAPSGACSGTSLALFGTGGSGGQFIAGGHECVGVCNAMQLEAMPGHNSELMDYRLSYAVLQDNTNPAQDPTTGSNRLTSGQWLRGTVQGGNYFTDFTGTGVRQSTLLLEGNVYAQKNSACNFALWSPCPEDDLWAPTFNTTTVTDGQHTISYTTADATLANTTTSSYAIKVDNTKPDTPTSIEATGDGMNGWSQSNDFGATWENGDEVDETTTQSGIASVVVDVNPTIGGQSNPAPVTIPVGTTVSGLSATKTSVDGVTVPAMGEWTMRLSLVDKAGNTSPVGDGSDGSPDSDVTAGWSNVPPAGPLGRANGWVSRAELAGGQARQTWQLPLASPPGEAGVCGWALSVTDNQNDASGTSINVSSPTTEWTFPSTLTEGHHWAHIRAINCALIPSTVTDSHEVNVDLTDPVASVSGVENDRWYKDGQQVVMQGTDALSGMVGAASNLPFSTDGAYISYKLNGEGPADQDAPRGGSAQINVTGEGQKTLIFSPVDVAGNKASPMKVNFGIDAGSPEGFIDSQDPERPTLLRAPISDNTSGVESAALQVRNTAGGAWTTLPTTLTSFSGGNVGSYSKAAVAEARFPDTKMEEGRYEVRVAAFDQAGNELVTSRSKNGGTHTIENPMRKATALTAAVFRGMHKCKRVKKSKCVKKKRGRVYLVGGKTSTSVGYKRAGVVQGYLTGARYAGLSRQPLEVYTKAQGQPEVLAGETSTKSDGSYYFRIKPGVSRSVRVVFPGTELLRDAEAKVSFGTAAKVVLKVNKRHVTTGGKVTFRGRVITVDKAYPQRGKIIALQYLTGGKWRPAVAITRTDAKGNFRVTYRFDRIPRSVRAKIKFRVYAPTELGFGHSSSASRTKVVRVN